MIQFMKILIPLLCIRGFVCGLLTKEILEVHVASQFPKTLASAICLRLTLGGLRQNYLNLIPSSFNIIDTLYVFESSRNL